MAISIKLEDGERLIVPDIITRDVNGMIGEDQFAQSLRDKMPNPYDFKEAYIQHDIRGRKTKFKRVIVMLTTGGCFRAWIYERDGKIYF